MFFDFSSYNKNRSITPTKAHVIKHKSHFDPKEVNFTKDRVNKLDCAIYKI